MPDGEDLGGTGLLAPVDRVLDLARSYGGEQTPTIRGSLIRREDLSQGAYGNSLQDAAMIRWHVPGKGCLPLAASAPAAQRRVRISSSPALCLVWACLALGQAADAVKAEGPPPPARRPVDAGAVGIVVQDIEPLPGDLRSRSADAPCSVLIRIGADAFVAPERIDPLLDAAAAARLRIAVGILLPGWERAAPGEVDAWATRAGVRRPCAVRTASSGSCNSGGISTYGLTGMPSSLARRAMA